MASSPSSPPARGAASNPANRFEQIHLEPDADWDPEQDPLPRTQFLKDRSSTIIAYNQSPDVGFDASINPYRGCEHAASIATPVLFTNYPASQRAWDSRPKS